jgi:N-sulfoglucosamine sulfohydrolase
MDGANRPWNLVIVTADDLNADSAGWMGSTVGATPNLDAFAATSHQFRNCHTVVPLCQPSRAAIMTGLLPHRSGALGFEPVRSDVTTLTEVMNAHGYFTAAINKIKHMTPPEKFNWNLSLDGSGKNPAALREQFEQCLKAADGKPFFINANSTDPHGPFPTDAGQDPHGGLVTTPDKIFSESEIVVPSFLEDLPAVREEVARYFSAVRRFDQTFGELIAALGTANHLNDTIIVFVSDHGMSMPYSKATLYRHATWTPVLLRAPKIDNRIVNSGMVANIDILPTVLDLLGLTKPEGLDGVSWLPLLRGEETPGRDYVFAQIDSVKSGRKFPGRCIRSRTHAYIWNSWADGKTQFKSAAMSKRESWRAIIEAAEHDPKLKARVEHFIYRCPEEFYDEENDPDDRRNLIKETRYHSQIEEMKALLLAHMEKTGDRLATEFRPLVLSS